VYEGENLQCRSNSFWPSFSLDTFSVGDFFGGGVGMDAVAGGVFGNGT